MSRRSPPGRGEQEPAPPRPRQAWPRSARTSGLQARAERFHGRRADARNLIEVVDRPDAAVLVAEVDDVLRGDRPDPLDRVEVGDRGRREADGGVGSPGWISAGGDRCGCRVCGRSLRNDTLLAVAQRGGEVDVLEVGRGRRAAGALELVVNSRACGEAEYARVALRA